MSAERADGASGADETTETEGGSGGSKAWKPVLSVREKAMVDHIRLQVVKNGTKSVGNAAIQELFERSPDPTSPREIIFIALSILGSEFTEEL